MVDLRYHMMLPILKKIVKKAPTEIMRRLVTNCEIKSAFPNIVDSMFQWGIDQERKRNRAATGIPEPKLPTLPSQYEPGIHFYEIKNDIKVRFKIAGAWGALMEVREWLQQVLKSFEGDGRFRMYEYNTLMNFWRLIFWANELWRCILFEEENEELVEKHRKVWKKELQGWTGLVLKCDWRDYFVIELEVQVRKLTLNILEIIVTAGYFEQTKNRYEILYRVIKDALTKDVFRDSRNVQHILKIVTWSVADVMIMKHLCYRNNEGNCLAQLLGENFLKVCSQESDPTTVAVLYLDYLYLLEALMAEKFIAYHHSKIARPETENNKNQQQTVKISGERDQAEYYSTDEDTAMDCDFAGTKLACPVKYNITAEEIPQNVELSDEDLNCWIDPIKYEDPYRKLKLCQCRKVMMGAAVFVLPSIFKFWQQSCMQYEQEMEARQVEESLELERLESSELLFNDKVSVTTTAEEQTLAKKLKARLEFLQEKKLFLDEFVPKVNQALSNDSSGDSDWNWDDIIRKGQEITTSPLPQWLSDYKRQSNVFDLALSKGIFLMNFLRARSENLAAAIGTEAYKEYMILIPLLRLYMDKLNLNGVDHNMLVSITAECEEYHMSNQRPSEASQQSQSRHLSSGPKDLQISPEIQYHVQLKELSVSNNKASRAQDQHETTVADKVEDISDALYELMEEQFVVRSG